MGIFDLNCMLGPSATNREPSFRTPEDLLCEMDRTGIGEALVYASTAVISHPNDGNAEILRATRDHARLHPCWVVLPPGTSGLAGPDSLVGQMRKNGVRAARIHPTEHNYPLIGRYLRSLVAPLEAARIPLIIDAGRTSWAQIALDWRGIFEIADAHPDLPIILLREGGTTERVLFEVWDQFPNIHLETSYIQASGILEDITERFGHSRLLFGSGLPLYDAGGPLGLLNGAQVTTAQRADIAGNNLRRLLDLPYPTPSEDTVWPCGGSGFRVFDIHGHLGLWCRKYYRDETAEQMVARMDALGIERFAVSDIMAIGSDYRAGNDRIGAGVAAYPDRIVGYAAYNPNYESEMADEMARCFNDLGCSGIKFHCSLHETSTESPSYQLGFRIAQERACPILCHAHQGPSPDFLMRVLADHPDAKFIYAHVGGGSREGLRPLIDVANARPNLFIDLGVSVMPRGTLAWLVEQVPLRQILYGSDHPLNEFSFQLGRVLYADIADGQKRAILWDNAATIFRIH
jgi:predicted TIM-barrel fold metal-dependent hydrolase